MWPHILLFGISGGEILILLLLVLILFGPKKIPEIARMVGRGMNEVKKVQREINSEIHRYSSEIGDDAKKMAPGRTASAPAGREEQQIDPGQPSKQGNEEPSVPPASGRTDDSGAGFTDQTKEGGEDLPYPYGEDKDEAGKEKS